jgi:5'-3' exonuclease
LSSGIKNACKALPSQCGKKETKNGLTRTTVYDVAAWLMSLQQKRMDGHYAILREDLPFQVRNKNQRIPRNAESHDKRNDSV